MTEPRERPILFSGPMVRQILADRKTQTRRLVTVPWKGRTRALPYEPYYSDRVGELWELIDEPRKVDERWGPYRVGQRRWVRETWYDDNALRSSEPKPTKPDEYIHYRADHDCRSWEAGCPCRDENGRGSWRPSIHMFRWASRLTLEVTEVRVQRLQEISQEDARSEGMTFDGRWWLGATHPVKGTPKVFNEARQAFETLWDSINGHREGASWAANPWVWAITFKRLETP